MPDRSATLLSAHLDARDADVLRQFGAEGAAHYLPVLEERAVRYAAHLDSMDVAPELVTWALAMRRKYGSSYVRAHYSVVNWLTALLIVRYGEEPDAAQSTDPNFQGWPTAFTDDDAASAANLLRGTWNEALTLLTVEG